jgi:hypothetical protein
VRFNTTTQVGGRDKVLGMVKHHVDVVMNCSLTVDVSKLSLGTRVSRISECLYKIFKIIIILWNINYGALQSKKSLLL